jgi:hypothetical protein
MLSCVVAIMQNSARAQQSAGLVTREAGHDPFSSPASSSRLQVLIANPRLESKLSGKDPNELQISNRERMAFSCSPASRESVISNLQNLIVTPRLEFPVTPTKQNSKLISNRHKTPFFSPLFHSSLTARHPSLASVAPTSRKAIMSRNHFKQTPRPKPLMRKVTNADTNQS